MLLPSTSGKYLNATMRTANAIIKQCLPHANKSIRIGITGVPGVGKSTFIEAFGCYLTSLNKKVGHFSANALINSDLFILPLSLINRKRIR